MRELLSDRELLVRLQVLKSTVRDQRNHGRGGDVRLHHLEQDLRSAYNAFSDGMDTPEPWDVLETEKATEKAKDKEVKLYSLAIASTHKCTCMCTDCRYHFLTRKFHYWGWYAVKKGKHYLRVLFGD